MAEEPGSLKVMELPCQSSSRLFHETRISVILWFLITIDKSKIQLCKATVEAEKICLTCFGSSIELTKDVPVNEKYPDFHRLLRECQGLEMLLCPTDNNQPECDGS
ncbi:hypothetical protein Celaphus_00017893 [Cervus elaphus hippelaphus]|uniref:Uncharacterized protein n=1 Tax=Cervus elaphus hippelaphus TaxID=46360 RepID=A0A212C8T0_CEREH|nr:hypothetical protein Celaphus_00017893 [Cervus elaphus hippelaphus]